jgi:CRP-like cAMP-binding protein
MASEKNSHNSGNLYPEELNLISDRKKQLDYLPGETLFKQGAFAPHVMYIIEGLIKVYLQAGKERQINLRIAQAGDFLAFSSLFDDSTYNYSAVALVESKVCMIDKTGLSELLHLNPDFAMRITSRSIKGEKKLLEIITNMSYKQMRGKLASSLLYLTSDEFGGADLFQYLTRHDIAGFASISTESAIKFLKEFEKEKILGISGRNIEIIDRQRLQLLADKG